MSFHDLFHRYSWSEIQARINSAGAAEVRNALQKPGRRDLNDFIALVSPAGAAFLEEMSMRSAELTRKRFGNTMQMYIPMYLSNECQNVCTYCGFSFGNKIKRLTLTEDQMVQEAQAIKALGYDHVLLVTGESNKLVGLEYLKRALHVLRPYFSQITMEVQPLGEEEYSALRSEGLYGVLVYQETYHTESYAEYHPKGKKSNFEYRLDTPDRLGRAHVHKIGLGTLLGLEDWRTDAFFVALHLSYLEKKYWKTKFSISFPRLRPAQGALTPRVETSEQDIRQLICAYRLFNENVELSLSTREDSRFRDELISSGITSMSAGSRTDPGGYAIEAQALKQFEISDERSPQEVATAIRARGFEPVWKDWESRW